MRGRVTSLQFAVTVVGSTTVRTMATGALTDLDDESRLPADFWDVSTNLALAAAALAPGSDHRPQDGLCPGLPGRGGRRPAALGLRGRRAAVAPVRESVRAEAEELRPALLGRGAAAPARTVGEPVPAGRRWPGMDLTCPKCQGTMRTYERNGVHVDQCTDCRGIFLDRGELERLVDAENAWHGSGPGRQPAPPPAGRHDSPGQATHAAPPLPGGALGAVVGEVLKQARAGQHGSSHGYGTHGKKKQQSFLSDLFG